MSVRIEYTNGNRQCWARVTNPASGPLTGRAVRGTSAATSVVKMSPAAARALTRMFPATVPADAPDGTMDRTAALIAAVAMVNADVDRNVVGMVWDVHIFAAIDPDANVRPGVVTDDHARAMRRTHGLGVASVASPAPIG